MKTQKNTLTKNQAQTIARNMFLQLEKHLPLLPDGMPYVIEVHNTRDTKTKSFDFKISVENDINGNWILLQFNDVMGVGLLKWRKNGKLNSLWCSTPFVHKDFLVKFCEKITDFI